MSGTPQNSVKSQTPQKFAGRTLIFARSYVAVTCIGLIALPILANILVVRHHWIFEHHMVSPSIDVFMLWFLLACFFWKPFLWMMNSSDHS
jgi:hypothetical protein